MNMLCREISKFLLFSFKLTECLQKCRSIELPDHWYPSKRLYVSIDILTYIWTQIKLGISQTIVRWPCSWRYFKISCKTMSIEVIVMKTYSFPEDGIGVSFFDVSPINQRSWILQVYLRINSCMCWVRYLMITSTYRSFEISTPTS